MAKVAKIREAFKGRATAGEIRAVAAAIQEDIQAGKMGLVGSDKVAQVSIRDIAEATLGSEVVQKLCNPSNGTEGSMIVGLREAVDPVKLSAFSNITGELIVRTAYEAYTAPELIGSQLVTEDSDNQDNVRVAGLAAMDDDVLEVAENEEYPTAKFGEDYVDRPSSKKRGLRCSLTKEMIFFDKTGKLAELAAGVGERLGVNKEKRILRIVLGLDNPYTRKGVARNTYVASADPRINKLGTNELVDWTDVDAALQLFSNYTDDRVNGDGAEPISVLPDTMIVMPQYLANANRVLGALQVRQTAGGIETISNNPIKGMKLLTSPWLIWMLTNTKHGNIGVATAKKHWMVGQPKKAFRYTTLFPFAVTQQSGGQDEFDRDVVASWKASERGVAWVWAPWYMAYLYDT